ncbi:unnamed protein product [Symbiodinium natans]|uniref:Methyltransferase domain-containing protein n=1 Tax=Symbiodinium natans TaxID=878477 RepID=A0A812P928_9DINO|nr:unnamed protein product [Symbiodinium natans]
MASGRGFALCALLFRMAWGLKLNEVFNEVQSDLQEGLALQASLEKYAATLPEGATKELLRSFKICGSCANFRRFGEPHDGGYLMCMDHMDGVTAAYSVGVEQHDKWSGDVTGTWKVPLYQMDCTVSQPAEMCPGCKFFRSCLTGSTPGGPQPAWTLSETLQQTGQGAAAERSLFGKIDIEGSEWAALADADVTTLKKFRQLAVEFHWLQEVHKHPDYLRAMQKLQLAGFRVVHLHGNNFASMFDTTDYKIPQVVEVTFDSEATPMATCLQDQQLRPLDMPNNANNAELPPAHLPSL